MNFKPADIARYIKSPDPKMRGAVIFGTNEGMMADYARQFAQTVCPDLNDAFRVAVLEMDTLEKDIGALYGEFNARSLMGGRRVVIVKEANNNLTAPLKEMVKDSQSDTFLVITSGTINTKSSLVNFAKEREDFALVACYDDREGDLRAFSRNFLINNSMTAEDEAVELLSVRLSGDRKVSLGEMNKLATYLGTRRHVTAEDVRSVVCDSSDSSFEDLCYLTGCGRTEKALEAYQELLHHGEEPAGIVRSLSYHFLRLLECGAAIAAGTDIETLIKNMRPQVIYYRKSDFALQLRIWNKKTLLDVLDILYNCERDCKTTNYPAEEAVSYTLMRISGAARRAQAANPRLGYRK
jgi:DNA polymerase-3 subunit delta